jgi:biopolymer transport protein ExbD
MDGTWMRQGLDRVQQAFVWKWRVSVSYLKMLMTEINAEQPLQKRRGVARMKKANLRVDMTPMVDLGFLLIAFFILTTQLSQPAVMDLYMPKDSTDRTKLPESKSLTILVGKNDELYYYSGTEEDALKNNSIKAVSYADMRTIIQQKQKQLDNDLMVLIKPGKSSSYKHIVNILDEMLINGVKRYVLLDPDASERSYLEA